MDGTLDNEMGLKRRKALSLSVRLNLCQFWVTAILIIILNCPFFKEKMTIGDRRIYTPV